MCSTGIGHAECFTSFTESEYVGSKADADSWKQSKNLKYKRKVSAQQGTIIRRRNQT